MNKKKLALSHFILLIIVVLCYKHMHFRQCLKNDMVLKLKLLTSLIKDRGIYMGYLILD